MIAHPPCTYLCNSGVRWLNTEPGRRDKMRDAAHFFVQLQRAKKIPRKVIENPVPHRYAREWIGNYTQTVQPWMFGDNATKRTCLWLEGVEPLVPEFATWAAFKAFHDLPADAKPKPEVHYAAPGPNRWKLRSATYPGLARALAEQLG